MTHARKLRIAQHPPRTQVPYRNEWLLYTLIVFVLCLAAFLIIVNRYQSHLQIAEESLNNLTLVNSRDLQLRMRNVEQVLQTTASEFRNSDGEVPSQEFISLIVGSASEFRTLLILDATGTVLADSRPDTPALGMNAADRAYFIAHSENRATGLFIDVPVQSRLDGAWSLPITQGVQDKNGEFIGVVAASLDPIFLSNSLGEFTDREITGHIAQDNGITMTSLPYEPDQIGTLHPFTEYIPPYSGLQTDFSSVFTANGKLVVQRHIEPFGWEIILSQPISAIVRPFTYEAATILFVLLGLCGVTFLIFRQQIQITEHRRQSEQELRTLTENITDIVVRFNRDLQHTFINRALLTSTGLTKEQYLGKTNREIGLPEHLVSFWDQQILQVFAAGKKHEMEFSYETKEGPRWFQARLTPEFDENQQVQTVLSVVRDITNLKETQVKLKDRTRRLELSLKAAQAGVWEWNIQTNAVIWDEMMEKMHGLPVGSFGGDYDAWRAVLHPDDVEDVTETVNASVATHKPFNKVFRIVQPNGKIRDIQAHAEVITDPETGKPVSMIGVNIDVTDQKALERARFEAERNKIEMEEKRKVLDLKGRFIATASHDFRTPLTVIITSIELLENYGDKLTDAQRLAKISTIKQQANYMIELLEGILTVSQSHANKLNLSLNHINLREFCDAIWSDMVTIDNGAHLKEFNMNATVEEFTADSSLLRQVLDNLLENAKKYTPDGKSIKFDVWNDSESVFFAVSDQGYGIPQEDIDHLFEPFHRAKNVSSIKGTGLGLTIVKDFIDLHQGEIQVTSREGKGTTFTVTIPIDLKANHTDEPPIALLDSRD